MADLAEGIAHVGAGNWAAMGRVIGVKGFSTLPVDELVILGEDGRMWGQLLGRVGAERLLSVADEVLASPDGLTTVSVEIHGPQVKELGLACGGQADVLLQITSSVPPEFWTRLAGRAPVAMVSIIDGPAAGAGALVVEPVGGGSHRTHGRLHDAVGPEVVEELTTAAVSLLTEQRTTSRRIETAAGTALVESWVPSPRLVVVGSGDVVSALEAQAGLLGWEVRSTESVEEVEGLLGWAGASAALIVLSHDPHVDTPALQAGLARPIPYIGAMGSRGTQSRRMDRLAAAGVNPTDLDRIHRPIGLNLGGRRAPEVALAIVAEILAVRHGRDAQPLKSSSGPIRA